MWEVNGIIGRASETPLIAGKQNGVALVMGSGRCLWQDLFGELPRFGKVEDMDVIAINDLILHWPGRIRHGVSLHKELPELFKRARMTETTADCLNITTHAPDPNGLDSVDYSWGLIEGGMGGTSALFATMIALAMGYEKVVLAGVPLDASGRLFDPPTFNGKYDGHVLIAWQDAKANYFKDRVRALSGNAVAILGKFDQVWLHG